MGGGDAHCECHRPCDSHPSPSYPPSLFPPFTLAQEPPPCPSLHGRHPRSRSTGTTALYGRATFPGLQLLLGPGTSGVDVTFILLVVDAKASRTRQVVRRARGPAPPA